MYLLIGRHKDELIVDRFEGKEELEEALNCIPKGSKFRENLPDLECWPNMTYVVIKGEFIVPKPVQAYVRLTG